MLSVVLLGYCLDEVASTRNKSILRSFLIALTQGGPNGMPRPIEIHAHDPLRYVGDMLAWIHQALASESELINSLLANTNTNSNFNGINGTGNQNFANSVNNANGIDKSSKIDGNTSISNSLSKTGSSAVNNGNEEG